MNTQTVHRRADNGEFVTAEYAEAHPDTTVTEQIPIGPQTQPDPMDIDLAWIEEHIGTRLVLQTQFLGEDISNVDPREVVRLARVIAERRLEEQG